MSYFGNNGFRSSRSLMLPISCLVNAIPFSYVFSYVEMFNRIVGGWLFQAKQWNVRRLVLSQAQPNSNVELSGLGSISVSVTQ
jgi:hypothetical protein